MEVSLDWKLFLSPFILANLASRISLWFVHLTSQFFGTRKFKAKTETTDSVTGLKILDPLKAKITNSKRLESY